MLSLLNLNKSYSGKFLLKNVTYNFPQKGVIALIGANGAGKTTLLNILSGTENMDNGQIIKQKEKKFAYLKQEPNPNPLETILLECTSGNEEIFELNKKMQKLEEDLALDYTHEKWEEFEKAETEYRNRGGYSLEDKAKKILLGIGFKEEQLEIHPTQVSGGWRMRLEIAKLLIQNPDFLILDEPTNHLDLPSIEWLEEYLEKFAGVVLFVSHDESLLNSMPDRILHLKNGCLKEYIGNYDDFLEESTQAELNREKSLKTLEKKIKQLSRFVDRFKAKSSLASQARSKMKVVDHLKHQANELAGDDLMPELNIKIPLITQSGKTVLQFEGIIGYEKALSKKTSFTINRGQKIGIIGSNGLGKSTLIKTIVDELPIFSGNLTLGHNVKIGYHAQDQINTLDLEKNVLENMQSANPGIGEQKIRAILGSFLFRKNDINKPCKVLSGGEKSRLSLACMLLKDLNFLILDEPTNHLDIMSTQILAKALDEFEGTVLFVSHNRSFIETLSTNLLLFQNDHTIDFVRAPSAEE